MPGSRNPLITTLIGLRGNQRACVYTEPLWGLSLNLILPYLAVYMLALGLRDVQIGLVTTVGMGGQVIAGVLGGIITDKVGRRRTTLLLDATAWSIPCLIWLIASYVAPSMAFWVFLGASLVNSLLVITQNSWTCLMVEDADRDQIPHLFSLVMVGANLSALFAPISALLVARLSLILAVRILLVNAAVVMTVKVLWVYWWSHETSVGLRRQRETAGVAVWRLVSEYRSVLGIMLRSRATLFGLAIAALFTAIFTVNNTFWQIAINQRLLVPDVLLPFFPMAKSLLAIVFYFAVIHKVSGTTRFRLPLLAGFGAYLVGQVLIAAIPAGPGEAAGWQTYVGLAVCVLFDSFGLGMLAMLAEAIIALAIDPHERSRIMAVQRIVVIAATVPFGWIAGLLSEIDRSLPFVLTSGLAIIGIAVTLVRYKGPQPVTVTPPVVT